jgi:hypothetical protein
VPGISLTRHFFFVTAAGASGKLFESSKSKFGHLQNENTLSKKPILDAGGDSALGIDDWHW